MNWYYVDAAGQQAGPVDDAGLEALRSSGTINSETLVWNEGMANWQPYREVQPSGSSGLRIATAAPPMYATAGDTGAGVATGVEEAVCSECGGIFPATDTIRIGTTRVCARCKPVVVQKMREGLNVETAGSMRYAGFWTRFAAMVLDSIILGVFNMGLNMAVFGVSGAFANRVNPAANMAAFGIMYLVQLGVFLSYETFMIGRYGATLGKMACKIQVVVADGSKVSYMRALGRYFAFFLSYFTCLIGFIMAGFDSEKRALHDRICNTRVVFK
jgi:uncharacterized RDD family membrane protein YckC